LKNLLNIIEGCISNDAKCQKALYEHYYGYALKIVFRYIFRYDKATDVTNDGFVKIFRSFNRFECKTPADTEMVLMGWMRRIMVNTAIDELRKNHMTPEIGYVQEHIWEPADPAQQSDQTVLYKELIEQVRKLPPSYRAVFNMHVIDGFAHHEIAEQLGITVGTCKSHLSKAREHLKKMISKNAPMAKVCNL
jgi:RNA polymerase sigma factor (sigma-70 family)